MDNSVKRTCLAGHHDANGRCWPVSHRSCQWCQWNYSYVRRSTASCLTVCYPNGTLLSPWETPIGRPLMAVAYTIWSMIYSFLSVFKDKVSDFGSVAAYIRYLVSAALPESNQSRPTQQATNSRKSVEVGFSRFTAEWRCTPSWRVSGNQTPTRSSHELSRGRE